MVACYPGNARPSKQCLLDLARKEAARELKKNYLVQLTDNALRTFFSAAAPRLSRSLLLTRIYPILYKTMHTERNYMLKVRAQQKELTSDCRRAAAAEHIEASRVSWQSMPGTGHQASPSLEEP